jgi:type II secretory pathway predicted ATPase ExeA
MRPLLIIDEAQECSDLVLNELRLLSYTSLDSQIVLSVILAGDKRLDEKLRKKNLIPLLSRVRYRFEIPSQSSEELLMMLNEVLEKSGNAQLMSEGLKKIVTEKSLGNPRAMMNIGQKLLLYAQQKQQNKLTEELWIEINKP